MNIQRKKAHKKTNVVIQKKTEYFTPQSLIAEALNQLSRENEKQNLNPEQKKLLNMLANTHRNYNFARANINRFIDFCLQKGLIKKGY